LLKINTKSLKNQTWNLDIIVLFGRFLALFFKNPLGGWQFFNDL